MSDHVYTKSSRLKGVCYDVRGKVVKEASRLEEDGHSILKLNIGNPSAFGLGTPDEMLYDFIKHVPQSQGYCDSKGLFSARKAVMQHCQEVGIGNVGIEDIYIGNGTSELIMMSLQGLLDIKDEILLPTPDYPLWTAAIKLNHGVPVPYICDESNDWQPDIDDIKAKITKRTKGIVLINPNNPTGSVYSKEILEMVIELARQHNLIIFADEIYAKIVYDGAKFHHIGSLCEDVLILTFNGVSKAYRASGFRIGWMIISGTCRNKASDFIEGLDTLAATRLCANVPGQHVIQAALGGYQSIEDMVSKAGVLTERRDTAYRGIQSIEGVSCVKPKGALYLFPKIDLKHYGIHDDERLVYDFLRQEKILLVHGRAFNWPTPDHFRVVFLPEPRTLNDAFLRLKKFLSHYTQS